MTEVAFEFVMLVGILRLMGTVAEFDPEVLRGAPDGLEYKF